MNIADAIKKCALDAYDAKVPCDVFFGEVEEVSPWRIRAGSLVLEGEILFVCAGLLYKDCTVTFGGYERTVVINEGLKKGDGVVLLRKSGGSEYVVVAKLEGGSL